jgi:hypothetical protein
MTARALIAHGGPQRLPTRAAPSLVRALRDARGSPPRTPWTILCRLDRHHPFYATCIRVDGADRCDPHAEPNRPRHGVITITGIGDHLRLEWPITITGMRTAVIGDDVSILHEVTLGGTGKERGDRHPKVR